MLFTSATCRDLGAKTISHCIFEHSFSLKMYFADCVFHNLWKLARWKDNIIKGGKRRRTSFAFNSSFNCTFTDSIGKERHPLTLQKKHTTWNCSGFISAKRKASSSRWEVTAGQVFNSISAKEQAGGRGNAETDYWTTYAWLHSWHDPCLINCHWCHWASSEIRESQKEQALK